MNKQTNTPELRFPEFDEEWKKRKLGEVVNYKNGGSFESLVKNHGVYKLITLKSVNTEGKLCNSGKYIDDKCVETLCNDTLVMILSEQAPGLVGMTAIIPNNNEYVLNQRVAALVPKQFIDSQFLSKLINRNQKYFSVRSAGTKVKNISKGHVENFNFLSPNYTEQQKIGNFFSKLDQQIELEEKKLELLEQQKKGYMQKIFSQELRFKDENGSEYPNWKKRKIQDLMEVTSVKRIHQSDWQTSGVPFLRARDIVAYNKGDKIEEPLFISNDKYNAYSKISGKVEKGDLLVTGVGTIGVPFLIKDNKPLYFKDGNIIWLKNQKKLNENFLFYSFLSTSIQNYIKRVAGVGTVGTFTIKNAKKTPIFEPIKEEQEKIGNFFDKVDNLIKRQSDKIELLKQRKKGLLQKMFI
ncbi:restriction endonuclease subunit S [Staphylococcus saprophyticus]|uniref:restriction endonuclease subunit S n=3 Tax=Staphylococcus TaxID=1279 RepID=UPI00297138AD|nr:restriction endonuclease subunit S [Staphylococcus saprophyticus]